MLQEVARLIVLVVIVHGSTSLFVRMHAWAYAGVGGGGGGRSMGSNDPPPPSSPKRGHLTVTLKSLESIRIYIRVRVHVARSRENRSGNVLIIINMVHTDK